MYEHEHGYILFSDLKGFSKLTESEVKEYFDKVLPELKNSINIYRKETLVWNTWGDAIIAVFKNGIDACSFALELRRFFNTNKFARAKKMSARIGGHFGEFSIINDPLTDKDNAFGININTSARIEPVTRPGEIFVTENFKRQIDNMHEKIDNVRFDSLGNIPLAKNFGEFILYRLSDMEEEPQIIDEIYKPDLTHAFPEPNGYYNDEKKIIDHLNTSPSKEKLLEELPKELQKYSGLFIFEIVRVCMKYGIYEQALFYAQELEKWSMPTEGINIYPYKQDVKLQKIKANALTRLAKYEEAANIVYGLYVTGNKDSDTLSMLAAQYKRRALMDGTTVLPIKKINKDYLNRAVDLYLSAFRLNIDDYYPAINCAYLYKIDDNETTGKGNKLAAYIYSAWKNKKGEDWWLDATLAETKLLQGDYEKAFELLNEAVNKHNPTMFNKQSVKEQISIYAKIKNLEPQLARILKLLSD